ncbi:hypothetical protein CROQUDRAFT_697918 [Cronartium quercuum f. sp. fusiforme G11]|uniref:Uncharacterized protein n=1 Tax=Cronartium quercuum f. sp. fusiforme G11 TaxID=708437 RepID=A0A9P6NIH9_9BASI|nr:hypothetical protein CROQUDRAFT_697918 [Cronartium quercuum f. sp. fusiforme G11]
MAENPVSKEITENLETEYEEKLSKMKKSEITDRQTELDNLLRNAISPPHSLDAYSVSRKNLDAQFMTLLVEEADLHLLIGLKLASSFIVNEKPSHINLETIDQLSKLSASIDESVKSKLAAELFLSSRKPGPFITAVVNPAEFSEDATLEDLMTDAKPWAPNAHAFLSEQQKLAEGRVEERLQVMTRIVNKISQDGTKMHLQPSAADEMLFVMAFIVIARKIDPSAMEGGRLASHGTSSSSGLEVDVEFHRLQKVVHGMAKKLAEETQKLNKAVP